MLTLGSLNVMEALCNSPDNIHYLFDQLPMGTVVTDDRGIIVYYNQAQSRMDGLEPDFAVGKARPEIYDFLKFPDIAKICQTHGRPILGIKWLYRTVFGKTINASNWVYPLFKARKAIGTICFAQALTIDPSPVSWTGDFRRSPEPPVEAAPETKKLLGGNPQFKQAVHIALSVASSPSPVLIAGETGTGKEMFARLLHESSPRRKNPFIAINCAAIPADLLEGLLFGTARGGFTGATDRPGLLEEADGGVLFLDEVASMPMELQPKLLRVLEGMRVRRIGSSVEKKLNLKLVSSVDGPMLQVMEAKRLRQDLFYRLAVVVLELPALRDRLDDLELLSDFFITKYNRMLSKKALKISPDLWDMMRAYNWPGNVRELEHLVAGLINMAKPDEEVLDAQHLPPHYQCLLEKSVSNSGRTNGSRPEPDRGWAGEDTLSGEDRAWVPGPGEAGRPSDGSSLKGRLGQNESALLTQALIRSHGNVAKAARELGLSRQLLAYKMDKYGLARNQFAD